MDRNIFHKIKDIYQEIIWFIQRGKRGWSDRDSWSIDWWLAEIMPSILKKLKNNKIGIPLSCLPDKINYTDYETKLGQKKWHKILDNIIYTFETSRKIQEENWIYCPTKEYFKKNYKDLRENMKKLNFTYIMSFQECKKFEEGQKLFWEYFFNLWD
jgi:hypothetical protein